MTTIEQHTRRNQLLIRKAELEDLLAEREQQDAEKLAVANETLLRLTERYNKRYEELLKKEKELKAILAKHEQNQKYVDAGQLVFQEMKDEIRKLSCQVEGMDLNYDLLNKQLSAFTPSSEDIGYLKTLAQQLKARREKIFLRGSISPDEPGDSKDMQYQLGKQIGKSPIPIH